MAKSLDPKVRRAKPYGQEKRKMRYPKHPFQLRTRPFQIQPFMLAPVLPGETLKNLVLQSRVVTKPLKHRLVGWWCEYQFFYVSLRMIEQHIGTPFLSEMVTAPTTYDPADIRTAIGSGADAKYYNAAGGTNWLKAAYGCCVEWFYRDEGEDWDDFTLDGMALAQRKGKNWMDSLTLNDNKRTDQDFDLDANNDGNLTAREFLEGMEHYNALRESGLETMDYEDWIRTFGVSVPERQDESQEIYKPELIREWSQWAYPVNTVEPTTGVPSSAVSWINALRADKDRYFKEPGFIIGLTIQRPKVYIKDQTGQLAGFMQTLENWLPAVSHEAYERGYLSFAANAGPLNNKISDGSSGYEAYWVDLRDLFVYGDQFLNYAPDAASSALTMLDSGAKFKYPTTSEIDDLFAAASPANTIETDGVVDLAIAGRQRDRTRGQNVL